MDRPLHSDRPSSSTIERSELIILGTNNTNPKQIKIEMLVHKEFWFH